MRALLRGRIASLEELTELCIHCHIIYLRGETYYYGYVKMRKLRHR